MNVLNHEVVSLSGKIIVLHQPVFSENGEFIFLASGSQILVYVTKTGELSHPLQPATNALLSFELAPNHEDTIVGFTIDGMIFSWHWSTGTIISKEKVQTGAQHCLMTSNILNYYSNKGNLCAFITAKAPNSPVQSFVIDINTGAKMKVPLDIRLKQKKPLVAVNNRKYKLCVIVQGFYVYFLNYETWKWTRLKNAHGIPITALSLHPEEEIVATGDEFGQIFLWRDFMDNKSTKTNLFHWHHTPVRSIAFTPFGTSFYSSGCENVLVKWNIDHPEMREYLPRLSLILKIAVSRNNSTVAVSTSDNAVIFLDSTQKIQNCVQEVNGISNLGFSVGLRHDSRSNTLVLNGRTGHLQFFCPHTKRVLYNIDIVMQNKLSMELGKDMYDIEVTKAAFNYNWMATGEEFNDVVHKPEIRLKFWKYDEKTQSYVLNTCVELPHKIGFRAIEFSSKDPVRSLYCVTIGYDNVIKMWTLDDSEKTHIKEKSWCCIAQTTYKRFSISCVAFSQDTTLLAAGCEKTVCIYDVRTLKLKSELNPAPGIDGFVKRVQLKLPENGKCTSTTDNNDNLTRLFNDLVIKQDDGIFNDILSALQSDNKTRSISSKWLEGKPLSEDEKAIVYTEVLSMDELDLLQQIEVLHKLGIKCKAATEQDDNFLIKFLANCRTTELLGVPQTFNQQITNVQFGTGKFAHYVIACTCHRVLIWDLFHLRLITSIPLSVKHFTYEPLHNLITIFDTCNTLYVFQPDMPVVPIHVSNIATDVISAAWAPRREPRGYSVLIDWQSDSVLYFLTLDQSIGQIKYLELMPESLNKLMESQIEPIDTSNQVQYATFGTFATKCVTDVLIERNRHTGPLVIGSSRKNALKTFMDMSTHTMPQLSLLCNDFIKSLVSPLDTPISEEKTRQTNGYGTNPELFNGFANDEDDDDTQLQEEYLNSPLKTYQAREQLLRKPKDNASENSLPSDSNEKIKNIASETFSMAL